MKYNNILQAASYIIFGVYAITGLVTVVSIVHGIYNPFLNTFMGTLFIGLGYFGYAKIKSLLQLMEHIPNSADQLQLSAHRFLLFEGLCMSVGLLIGIAFLTAVLTRVLGEQLPVFG
jgi:hypothetical protein